MHTLSCIFCCSHAHVHLVLRIRTSSASPDADAAHYLGTEILEAFFAMFPMPASVRKFAAYANAFDHFCGRRIFTCAASTLKTTVFRLHSANIGMDRFQPVLRACAVNALSFLARRALSHARVDPSSNPHSHSSAAAPPPWFYAIHSDALSAELDAHPTADSTLPILPTRVRFAAQLAHFETAPVSDSAIMSASSTAIRPLPCAQGTVLI